MKLDGWWIAVGVVFVAAAVVFYNNSEGNLGVGFGGDELTPDRSKHCRALSGAPEARLKACLAELDEVALSKGARALLDDLGKSGKTFLVGADIGSAGGTQLAVEDHPDVLQALQGTDEAEVSKQLRDLDVRGLVVHRDITQALDRDKVVLSRLAHHDHIEWFQLRRVTEELMIYTVRSSRARIPLGTADSLLKGLRARLAGQRPPKQTWNPSTVRLLGTMRLQGRSLATRHSVGSNLEVVLNELADKLIREWEREVAVLGVGSLRERLDDIRLEVHVVMERAVVEPRSRFAIFDLWELGIDGMMFRHREGAKDEKFTYMPGSVAATRSWTTADKFLREAVKTGGWHDTRPWEDRSTRLDLIRSQHFMESKPGGGEAVRLIRGNPEVKLSEMTDKRMQKMLIDGGDWWMYNLYPDNHFEYKYWPTQNRRSTEYNEVRHILAARDLADAWRYKNDDRYLEGSRRSMDWLLKYAVHDTDEPHPSGMPHPAKGAMLFRYPSFAEKTKPPNQKLGTVAVALLGWVAWAQATGSHAEDENIRKMAVYTLSQLNESGKFEAYNVPRSHPYYGNKNDIVPGEAALALGMVAEYFGEPEWLDFYPKFIEFYRPWFRSRKVKTNPYGRWPHESYANETRLDLVQFGPWAVMASKQRYLMTGDEEAAEFGLEIADWMIDYYQWSGARSPFPDYVGGYYKLPEELPAMQSFCYSEGTAAAYTIAAKYAPDRKDYYDLSTRETIRFLDLMQYDELSSYFVPDPKKVFGGIKYMMNANKIRIDYVGHGLSTLSQYLDARRIDPAVELDIWDPADLDRWGRDDEAMDLPTASDQETSPG